jgi:hypothetical protein
MSINLGEWESFRNRIKNHLDTNDISSFATWDILVNTMIAGVDNIEIEHIKKNWGYWGDKIGESKLQPNSHHLYPMSSTNNLHHAYSLQIMMDNVGMTLSDFGSVTEFGGGYGNTARLFRKAGFNGSYVIYDIPELCKIQDYYLTQNSITDIVMISGDDKLDKIESPSLFLGLWSITETPTNTRDYYVNNLKMLNHDVIFIAMGDYFYSENNMEWLNNSIIPELEKNNYECKIIKIEHGNGMYYFSAKKLYK